MPSALKIINPRVPRKDECTNATSLKPLSDRINDDTTYATREPDYPFLFLYTVQILSSSSVSTKATIAKTSRVLPATKYFILVYYRYGYVRGEFIYFDG
jgi:hypothetical protein